MDFFHEKRSSIILEENPLVSTTYKKQSIVAKIQEKRASMLSTQVVGTETVGQPITAATPNQALATAVVSTNLASFRTIVKAPYSIQEIKCTTTVVFNGKDYLAVGSFYGEIYLKELIDSSRLCQQKKYIKLVANDHDVILSRFCSKPTSDNYRDSVDIDSLNRPSFERSSSKSNLKDDFKMGSQHSMAVENLVSFSYKKNTILVSASLDGTLRAWTLDATKFREDAMNNSESIFKCDVIAIGECFFEDGLSSVAVHILDAHTKNPRPIIVSAGRDNNIRFWDYSNALANYCQVLDYNTGRLVNSADLLHEDWITSMVLYEPKRYRRSNNALINKAGKKPLYLITGSYDKTVKVYMLTIGDGSTATSNNPFNLVSNVIVNSATNAYGKISTIAETVGQGVGGVIGLDDDEEEEVQSGEQPSNIIGRAHTNQVKAVALLERDEDFLIISADSKGVIYYWNINSYQEYKSEALSSNNKTTAFREMIPLKKMLTGDKCINYLTIFDPKVGMNPVLFAASDDYKVRMWDIDTGDIIRTLYGHSESPLFIQVFHLNKCTHYEPIVISSDTKRFFVWNFQAKEEMRSKSFTSIMDGHEERINAVSIFYDIHDEKKECPLVATASADKTVRIFNYTNKSLVCILKDKSLTGSMTHDGAVKTLITYADIVDPYHIEKNSMYVITGGEDNLVKIWKIQIEIINSKKSNSSSEVVKVATCQYDQPRLMKQHKDDVTHLFVFKPYKMKDIEPILLSSSNDRSIKSFKLRFYNRDNEFNSNDGSSKNSVKSIHTYKGHTDFIHDLIAFDGNEKNDPKIVSSDWYGDVFVWDYNKRTYWKFDKAAVYLTAVNVAEPFVACILMENNKDKLITFNPFVSSKSDLKKSSAYKSGVTSITYYEENNKVIIVTGHDDGSIKKVDANTKEFLDGNNNDDEEQETELDDGDETNDVTSLSVVKYMDPKDNKQKKLLAAGIANASVRVYDESEEAKLIQGRDAFVNCFVPINSNTKYSKDFHDRCNLLVTGCDDKVVRIVNIKSGAEKEIAGTANHFANYCDAYYVPKHDSEESNNMKEGAFSFLLVSGGNDKPFHVYDVTGNSKDQTYKSESIFKERLSDHEDNISGLKFLKFKKPKSYMTEEEIIEYNHAYPLVICSDKAGVLELFNYIGNQEDPSMQYVSVSSLQYWDLMYIHSPAISKATNEVDTATNAAAIRASVIEKKDEDKKDKCEFPIHCFSILHSRNLLFLGTKAFVPLIVSVKFSASEGYQLNPEEYSKQFKFDPKDDLGAGKTHKDEIVSICVSTHKDADKNNIIDVVSGSKDKTMIVWDYQRRRKGFVIQVNAIPTSISIFNNEASDLYNKPESLIVCACSDKVVRLYSLTNKNGQLLRSFDSHKDSVQQAMISTIRGYDPILLTASKDKQLRFLDAYYLLSKAIPTHQSIVQEYQKDRDEMLANSKDRKLTKDKIWPRITQFTKMASIHVFFAENADLFCRSFIDRDIKHSLDLATFFLPSAPEVCFIKQRKNFSTAVTLPQASQVLTPSNVQALTKEKKNNVEEVFATSFCTVETDTLNDSELMLKAVSPLEIAMNSDNKDAVTDVLNAISIALNRPLLKTKKDYYHQFFPLAKRLEKEDLIKISSKFPAEFINFLKSVKLQKSNPILDVSKPLKRPFERNQCKFKGVSGNADLVNLWPIQEATSIEQDMQWVTPLYIPIPYAGDFEMLKAYLNACSTMDDVTIFDGDVGNYALQFAWKKYARKVHIMAFLEHIIYCALFTTSLLSFNNWTNGVGSADYRLYCAAWVLQGACLLFVVVNYIKEFGQFRTESKYNLIEHLQDMWSVVDITTHTTLLIGTLIRIIHFHETDASRNTLSICAVFMYFKVLYYLRAFEQTGPLIAMIFQIAKDIVPFCIVLFIVIFGFSQSFWIISQEDTSLPFGKFYNSLLSSFDYMLGNFDSNFMGTSNAKLGVILYVAFMVIVALLLLNLLIALMGDSFANVKAKGIAQWRVEQATIIYEQQCLTWKSGKDAFGYETNFPSLIHVLVRSTDIDFKDVNSDDQILELNNKITTLETKLDNVIKILLSSDMFKHYDDDNEDDEDDEDEDEIVEEEEEEDIIDDILEEEGGEEEEDEEEEDYDDDDYNLEAYEINTLAVTIIGQDYEVQLIDQDDGWVCSGSNILSDGCVYGCTGPNQTYGWKRYYQSNLISFCEGCVTDNLQVKYVKRNVHRHKLVFRTNNYYICDCGDDCIRKQNELPDEDRYVGYGCNLCDFDLCGECCEKFERQPTQRELDGFEMDDQEDQINFALMGTLVPRRFIE